MATSLRTFKIGLYEEHLEEASFLYEQRRALLVDPELAWTDRHDFEERFEAHVDALVVGDVLALEVCRRRAAEGDAGELHAALRVFCRQGRSDLAQEVLITLDPGNDDAMTGAADALAHELPEDWLPAAVAWLELPTGAVAAHALGHRRFAATGPLTVRLDAADPATRPKIARALGRLRDPSSRHALLHHVARKSDATFRREALLALLRMGEDKAVEACRRLASEKAEAFDLLALAGGPDAVDIVLRHCLGAHPPSGALLALGLLGDARVVPTLLRAVGREETAGAAADALWLISGQDPREEVFIPEPIDEDTLTEAELERHRRGEPVLAPGAPVPGETVVRRSQDPALWAGWWEEARGRFQPPLRYRLGVPLSPTAIVASLEAPFAPFALRAAASEELTVRYGIDIGFEPDLTVRTQTAHLATLRQQADAVSASVEPGGWYFSRREIPGP